LTWPVAWSAVDKHYLHLSIETFVRFDLQHQIIEFLYVN